MQYGSGVEYPSPRGRGRGSYQYENGGNTTCVAGGGGGGVSPRKGEYKIRGKFLRLETDSHESQGSGRTTILTPGCTMPT